MCKELDQHANKIKGSFSVFDRMIVNGYFRLFLSEQMHIVALYKLIVHYKDFKSYFLNVTDMLIKKLKTAHLSLEDP